MRQWAHWCGFDPHCGPWVPDPRYTPRALAGSQAQDGVEHRITLGSAAPSGDDRELTLRGAQPAYGDTRKLRPLRVGPGNQRIPKPSCDERENARNRGGDGDTLGLAPQCTQGVHLERVLRLRRMKRDKRFAQKVLCFPAPATE